MPKPGERETKNEFMRHAMHIIKAEGELSHKAQVAKALGIWRQAHKGKTKKGK